MARAALPLRRSTLAMSPSLISAQLHRLRIERDLAAVIIGIVLITTFVFASIPRLFNDMADDGLQHAVTTATPNGRNLVMSRASIIPGDAGDDPFTRVEQEGANFQKTLAPSINDVIDDRAFLVDTARHIVVDSPETPDFPFPRYLTLRYQSQINDHIELVSGRMPAASDEVIEVSGGLPGTVSTDPLQAQVYEIAISPETARQLGVTIGDSFILAPHVDDPLVKMVARRDQTFMAAEIVGLIEPQELSADYWMSDPQLHRAVEYDDGNSVHIYATSLIAPDAYAQLVSRASIMFRYTWRYFVAASAFNAGNLEQLSADLRRLDAEYENSTFARPEETVVRSGLVSIFNRYLSQRNLSEAILSLSSVGLLAVALASISLVATLVAQRRRDSTALVRGRGGTATQLLGSQAVEGLILAIPGALLGFGIATLLVGDRSSRWSAIALAAIAILTTILLVLALAPLARRSLGALERGDGPIERASSRRIVIELFVVVLAGIGVYLLRRRGISGDSSTSDLNEFDPFLAAVPILLGLAVGLIALRLYPLPIRLLSWLAALRRDLVLVLGFRRVARQPLHSSLPMLVLLLSVAIGVFSSIMLTTVAQGQVSSSWQLVGADYHVTSGASGAISSSLDLSDIDAIEAIAGALLIPDALFSSSTPVFGTIPVLGVETQKFAAVNAGRPAEPNFPDALLEAQTGDDIGRPTNPIPALVSSVGLNRPLNVGDTFALNLFGREWSFVVAGTRDRFPGLTVGRPFIVTSFESLIATNTRRSFRFTDLYLRATDSAFSEIRASISEQSPSSRLESRGVEYDKVHDSPLISGVEGGFRVGLVVAAIYSAIAVVVALVLSSQARARDLAYLRTLGLSETQALGLTVVEQAPSTVLAIAIGIGLGIAVTRLIEPGIDLTAFTGEGIPVALQVDWTSITLLALGLIVIVAASIAGTTAVTRRASLGQALRLGDD